MRKFVLAAAVAGSALALAACSETADSAADTADAMAADVEANTEAAADAAGEAAEAAGEAERDGKDRGEKADKAARAEKSNDQSKLEIPILFTPRELKRYEETVTFDLNGLHKVNVLVKGEGIPL